MKIELIKNDAGKTAGWKIIGESIEDKLILGSMCNLQFFGMGDRAVEYNGMTTDLEDENYVLSMSYATKAYQKEEKDKLYESIINGE